MLAASQSRRSTDLSSAPRPAGLERSGSGGPANLQTTPALEQLTAGFPIEADSPVSSGLNFGYSREFSNLYTVGELLGTGGNAVVRRVMDKRTGTELACKTMPKELKVLLTGPLKRLCSLGPGLLQQAVQHFLIGGSAPVLYSMRRVHSLR